ncbi:hypothetical protein CBR_g26237 [Chara braunii]|uniref:Uncharacterized protein n=1 Tax=Chara braunii TaxID=69332 RepID=A0A388L7E6_CHABU|nr:hypothetical protein CBR_g26237 [Chara braunii]|eukprot:GBG78204.1 hypothetical protein CBR_g26237 [Chara braunii]
MISPATAQKQRLMRDQFWVQFDNIPIRGHPLIKDRLEVEYPNNKVLKWVLPTPEFLAPHCDSITTVLEVNTESNPEFPEEWEFCIGEEASSVTVSTKDAPICFRCRERGHLGTDPACPRSPEHSKEKKLRQNMLAEVEEAKGIWFVNDQDYNGWVFDDTIDDPKWIWTYNTNPSTKQPDIFPPSDSRWHAVGAKKVTCIPGKIHKDQIIDPRVIREEKKHEDLLWDMETIRTKTAETCQNTNLDNSTLLQEAKQTLEHRHPKPETPLALKRNASPSAKICQEDRVGKKRRATEEGSGMILRFESHPADDTLPGTDQKSPTNTKTEMDTSQGKASPIPWLEEYLQRAKYEREKEFDIRLACMKHLEKTGKPANGKTVAGIPQSKNFFDLLRMNSELSEFSAFRYHEKKRERESVGTSTGTGFDPQTSADSIRDMVSKNWKPSKGRDKRPRGPPKDKAGSKNEQRRLTQEIATVAAQTKRLFEQNQDYKKEQGEKFITVRMIAENKVPDIPKSANADRGTIRSVRPLLPVRFRSKFNEWQVATDAAFMFPTLNDDRALAKSIRDNITAETLLGVYGVPPREQTTEGKTLEEPIITPFDPILVKLDERAKLSEGLTWRAWDTITMLLYNVLNERFSTTDIIADSLADVIRTRLLTSKTSLQDEATPIDMDMGREDSDMEDEEEGEREADNKIFQGGDDAGPKTMSESSAGEYGLSSSAASEDSRDSDTDSSKTQAVVD